MLVARKLFRSVRACTPQPWKCSTPPRFSSSSSNFPFFSSTCADFVRDNMPAPGGDLHAHPETPKRFPDGAQYRIEIPSTEGLEAIKSVVEEAKKYNVTVHRVSQGSGITMMPRGEALDMLRVGRDNAMEVCLFVGPRNAWDLR